MVVNIRRNKRGDGFRVSFVKGGKCETRHFYYSLPKTEQSVDRGFDILTSGDGDGDRHRLIGYLPAGKTTDPEVLRRTVLPYVHQHALDFAAAMLGRHEETDIIDRTNPKEHARVTYKELGNGAYSFAFTPLSSQAT